MFTKGEKIIHSMNLYIRENGEAAGAAALNRAAREVRLAGGSFTSKDVAQLLSIAANIALGTDGREAARLVEREYMESVREIERAADARVRDAESRADGEFERARQEFGERAERAERMVEELEDEVSEYEELKSCTPECILDAVAGMEPESHLGHQAVRDLADYITGFGRSVSPYALELKMAV